MIELFSMREVVSRDDGMCLSLLLTRSSDETRFGLAQTYSDDNSMIQWLADNHLNILQPKASATTWVLDDLMTWERIKDFR